MPPNRALASAVSLALVAVVPAAAQTPLPADFVIPKAESSPGTVTFSHARHLPRVRTCSACHMRDIKMKRGASGPFTMAAMQESKQCGACHDGQTRREGTLVFSVDECDKCHR